jgi:hypothetical protein
MEAFRIGTVPRSCVRPLFSIFVIFVIFVQIVGLLSFLSLLVFFYP